MTTFHPLETAAMNALAEIKNRPLQTEPPRDEPTFSPEWATNWLQTWSDTNAAVGFKALTDNEKKTLQVLLPQLQALTAPAHPKEFAVALDKLLDFAETFGLPIPDQKTAVEFYRVSLGDLPIDLLSEAISATILNHKYHTLPKPADIRNHVVNEFAKRRVAVSRAKYALSRK